MNSYMESFLRLFFPATCGGCRRVLELDEPGLCPGCLSRLREWKLGMDCVPDSPGADSLDSAWSLFLYGGFAADLLGEIKFRGKGWLVRVFEPFLAEIMPALRAECGFDLIVPVPMDRLRHACRQFNQAELIAECVSRHCGVPIEHRALVKKTGAPAQSRLGQEERLMNLYGTFRGGMLPRIRDKRILLVDDIHTTGATAREAAGALKRAGTCRVHLLTLARTARPSAATKKVVNP